MEQETHIFAYGGSILSRKENKKLVYSDDAFQHLAKIFKDHDDSKFLSIFGGGAHARHLQDSRDREVRKLLGIEDLESDVKDLPPGLETDALKYNLNVFGIKGTIANGEEGIQRLDKIFPGEVCPKVLTNPNIDLPKEDYRIYIGGGFKPGSSTDNATMLWAEKLNATRVHKVSDYGKLRDVHYLKYKKKLDETYQTLDETTFEHIIGLVGIPEDFNPGDKTPLDPSAALLGLKLALENPQFRLNIGKFDQLEKMIQGVHFEGTVVRGKL